MLRKLDSHTQPLSHIRHKNNSKRIKDLNVRCQNIKFLEENMAGNFTDIGLSNAFVDLTPKAREMSQYKQMRLHQTKKPLYSDTDYYQNKKTI